MNKIVTISRQFGSGGREVGKRLADALNCAYYDQEVIVNIAANSGLSEKYIQSVLNNSVSSYYPLTYGRTLSYPNSAWENQAKVMQAQRQVILEMAEQSDCVIVGRCADHILAEYAPLNIFVCADLPARMRRCRSKAAEDEQLSDQQLKKKIKQIDKNRANYYTTFTGRAWGDPEQHHLCLNTSNIAIKSVIPALVAFCHCWFDPARP